VVRILVADDTPAIRKCLRGLLEHHNDWRVCDEAVNGKEAVEHFQKTKPDLIVIDLQMPEMNGFEATAAIRARERAFTYHQIPALLNPARVKSH